MQALRYLTRTLAMIVWTMICERLAYWLAAYHGWAGLNILCSSGNLAMASAEYRASRRALSVAARMVARRLCMWTALSMWAHIRIFRRLP
jgi:hypothetical protein